MDRARRPSDLPPASLARALRLLFASSRARLSLQLFGGEPALVPHLVRAAVTQGRRLEAATGKRLDISLTTNLIGWTDALLRFLAARRVTMLASLDGNESAQRWRSGKDLSRSAYAGMLAAARRFQELGGSLRVNMVVAPNRTAYMGKNLAFLRALDLGEVQAAYAITPGWTRARRLAYLKRLLLAGKAGQRQDLSVEPVLTFPQIYCDCGGTVSVGCAAVLEKTAPALEAAFRRGRLADFSSIDDIKGTRRGQEKLLAGLHAGGALPPFIRETLALGKAVKAVRRKEAP